MDDFARHKLSDMTAASPLEIPLLGVAPNGFGPSYDYLAKVETLAKEIGPRFYEYFFEQHFQQGHGDVFLIGENVAERVVDSSRNDRFQPWFRSKRRWSFDAIKSLRQHIATASKQNPCVVIVEAIDKTGVQALGMAFNINPCFFAKHLGSKTTRPKESNELSSLGNSFASLGISENPVRGTVEAPSHIDTPMTKPVFMDLHIFDYARTDRSSADWIFAGTDMILEMRDRRDLYPRIS